MSSTYAHARRCDSNERSTASNIRHQIHINRRPHCTHICRTTEVTKHVEIPTSCRNPTKTTLYGTHTTTSGKRSGNDMGGRVAQRTMNMLSMFLSQSKAESRPDATLRSEPSVDVPADKARGAQTGQSSPWTRLDECQQFLRSRGETTRASTGRCRERTNEGERQASGTTKDSGCISSPTGAGLQLFSHVARRGILLCAASA